jgi:fumarylacetoacetate (FAA) hydrolase
LGVRSRFEEADVAMKLATRADGSRDGRLLVVDPPLARAVAARACVSMAEALANWDAAARELRAEYAALAAGDPAGSFAFAPAACGPILPAPAAWLAGAPAPPVRFAAADAAGGVDVAADLVTVVGAVPADADRATAAAAVRLFTLAAGPARPSGATRWTYAPVATTPDDLGEGWDGVHVQGELELAAADDATAAEVPTRPLGVDVVARVVAAARGRALPAGTVLGLADPTAARAGAGDDAAFSVDMRDGMGRSLFGRIALPAAG